MSVSNDPEGKVRLRRRFYNNARLILENNPIGWKGDELDSNSDALISPEGSDQSPENGVYGIISDNEIRSIIDIYDSQREEGSSRGSKAIECDQIRGGSYAKLLFSKPGFHNPSSTSYLIGNLRIRDRGRESFLSGYSDYLPSRDDSIETLVQNQIESQIRKSAKEIYEMINDQKTEIDSTIANKIDELVNLDAANGDTLAVSGKWAFRQKRYDQAILDLSNALVNNCWDPESTKVDLCRAYYEASLYLYARGEYQEAFDRIEQSIKLDESNEGAVLHRGLCVKKMQDMRRPFGSTPNSFSSRRK